MDDLAILSWIALLGLLIYGFHLAPSCQGIPQLVSAHGIVLLMIALFLVLPSSTPVFFTKGVLFWAPEFGGSKNVVFGVWMIVISLASFLASYQIFAPREKRIGSAVIKPTKQRSLVMILLVLISLGVLLKLLAVQAGGGMNTTILRMSPGVSSNVGISRDPGQLVSQLRSFSVIADISATWLFILSLIHKRWRFISFSVALLVVILSLSTIGKRLVVLWPLIVIVLSISRFWRPITPKFVIFVIPLLLGFGFITLMYRIFFPLSLSGSSEAFNLYSVPWANGSLWMFYFNSLEFAYFELTLAAIGGRAAIIEMFGGQLELIYRAHIEPFSYIIPRAIWPNKPEQYLDLSHALAALIFWGDLYSIRLGVAASLIGTSWLSGGLIGLISAFLFLGLIAGYCDRYYYGSSIVRQHSPFRVILYGLMLAAIFHLFRHGTFGWVFIIVVVQQLGGILSLIVLAMIDRFVKYRRTLVQRSLS